MNLYYLDQYDRSGYDTYDSMVIAAESVEEAIQISCDHASYGSWSRTPHCRLIAHDTTEPEGVVCASFNAG